MFSFYNASGTGPYNPILCENNFVDGLYAGLPASQSNSGAAFTTDGTGTDASTECAYIIFENNTAVNVGAKGFQLPVGHDIIMENCETYDPGYTPDATHTPCYGINVGICGFNGMQDQSLYYNNVIVNCFSYLLRPPHTSQNLQSVSELCCFWLAAQLGIVGQNINYWPANATSAAKLYAGWQSALAKTGDHVGTG